MNRQVQFRQTSMVIDLNSSPYKMEAGSWSGHGRQLELGVVLQASTLAELERYVSALRRVVMAGRAHSTEEYGEAVWVFTKVCDDLWVTAEIGATWLRKRVRGGTVLAADVSSQADGVYRTAVTLSLEVDEWWQRAAPLPLATMAGGSSGTSGEIMVSVSAPLTAPRYAWSSTTGLTARYFWYYGVNALHPAVTTNFIKVGANVTGWWDEAAKRFKMQDDVGNTCQSGGYSFSLAQEVEVIFCWRPGFGMGIYVNGVKDGEALACSFADAATYTLLEPTSDVAMIGGVQVWPSYFTDAVLTGLRGWGRPGTECAFVDPPADGKNTNATFGLHHIPGDAGGPLRVVVQDTGGSDWDQVRVGLLVGRTAFTLKAECEGGTLGANTASVADTDASAGYVARFTPADTSWANRVTVTLCALAAELYKYEGTWRVLLAGRDNAAAININQVRWQLTLAGVATDWSDALALAAVGTRSLVDLGQVRIPPGALPEGATRASSSGYGGDCLRLEVQARNTTGSGGGALDLDCIYLQPCDEEGVATATEWARATQYVMLDFVSEPPAAVTVYDWRTAEYAGWADWLGDRLSVLPGFGPLSGSLLWVYGYRDSGEQAWPNDTLALTLFMAPRYGD